MAENNSKNKSSDPTKLTEIDMLAELLYDLFKEQHNDNIPKGLNNAHQNDS